MNKVYDINISVQNRTKFTKEALALIENNITDVRITADTEEEFADSIAEDIKSLNNGNIDGVEIILTCMEDLPYTSVVYGPNSSRLTSFTYGRDLPGFTSCNGDFEKLKILDKFCWNVVDEDLFIEMMLPRYHDRNYIIEKWPEFKKCSIAFIINRDERELYREILKRIEDTGYRG